MVKRLKILLLIMLLLILVLVGSGSWLLATRSGALWLLSRLGAEDSLRIELAELRGSLLDGLKLQGVKVDWPTGRFTAAQLQLDWQPAGLWHRQLQLERLRGADLALQLMGNKGKSPAAAADGEPLVPALEPLFSALGGWSLALQGLQIDRLQIFAADGSTTELRQLAGRLSCSGQQLSLSEIQFDGDWGSWRGALQLAGETSVVTAQLDWQPPHPFGPLDRFVAQLSLERTAAGGLAGPVELQGSGARGSSYRLAGELLLDRERLQLSKLQLDHGTPKSGLVRGALNLGWRPQLFWQADLELVDLNLEQEIGRATQLGGTLALQGTQNSYRGRIDLRNATPGWQLLGLSANLEGDREQLALRQVQGRALGGDIKGELDFTWRDGLAATFRLAGQDLQLAQIPDGPEGQVDLQFEGWLKKTTGQDPQLGGVARISRGVLLERDFSGELRGEWQGGHRLRLDNLELNGVWGALKAQGDLQQHLALHLELLDAAALWPPLKGAGTLDGWLAWTDRWPHGELAGHLQQLSYRDWQIGEVELKGGRPRADAAVDLELKLNNLQRGAVALERVGLQLRGLPAEHHLQLRIVENGTRAGLELQGALQKGRWQGKVQELDLSARVIESFSLIQPFEFSFGPNRAQVAEILLQGDKGGSLNLSGDWNRQDGSLLVGGRWSHFNLGWLNLWLVDGQFDGESSGEASLARSATGEIDCALQSDYVGALGYLGQKLQLDKARLSGRWDEKGLSIAGDILERGGGRLKLTAGSGSKAGLALPQQGELQLVLEKFPLGLLNAQLPHGEELAGLLAADLSGHLLGEGRFVLAGKAGITQGSFSYQGTDSRLELPVERAEFDFDWQQKLLRADIRLELGAGDGLTGDISLQLPARWPVDLRAQVPLGGEVKFQLGELGLLSLMVPQQLADMSAEIGGALRLGGSLQQPDFAGDLHVANGRLSVPSLGILLDQIGVQAAFNSHQLQIEQIELRSGEGRLKGQGEVFFAGWKPNRFRVELQGDRVLIVNLPELRALASPDIQLVGDTSGVTLSGMLKIPELQIVNWHPSGPLVRSDDVVYVDQLPKPESPQALNFNLDLGVELGERVVVKDRGLDVRLKGNINLKRTASSGVLARGEIAIPAGHYSAYGVKLPITSGRLYFNGGPADNPVLDIIAARKVKEVTAGVAVSGTARRPEIHLISEPSLDDTDILSYIVLGRPTTGGSGDVSALSLAAGALLSAGDSASFQQKLQTKSGLDVIDVNAGENDSLETSMLTVGKYLTPELYLSYGRALSSSASQVQLRYSPGERVDIESQFGEVSGADIYYRLEFGGD